MQKESLKREIMTGLYWKGMIETWYKNRPEGYMMHGGLWSPFYLNLRKLPSCPEIYQKAGDALSLRMEEIGFRPYGNDKVVGVAYAGIPMATLLSSRYGYPALYTRKENGHETYGVHSGLEGELERGDRLVLVDDVATVLSTKLAEMKRILGIIKERGLDGVELENILVLVDREQGGEEIARGNGYTLSSVIKFASEGMALLKDKMASEEYEVIVDYLKDPGRYQDGKLQTELAKMCLRPKGKI